MWNRPDPLGDGWNSYGYCLGNPILFIDPSGLVHEISQEAWEAGWASAENGQFNEMAAAAFEINSFGMPAFDAYVNDVDYGSQFFINQVNNWDLSSNLYSKTEDLSLRISGAPFQSIVFGMKTGEWGHNYFGGNDALRHQIGSFLNAEAYGKLNAFLVTSGNEALGFIVHDIPRLPSRIMGKSQWAFEWQDFRNNWQGIQKAGQ